MKAPPLFPAPLAALAAAGGDPIGRSSEGLKGGKTAKAAASVSAPPSASASAPYAAAEGDALGATSRSAKGGSGCAEKDDGPRDAEEDP